MTKFKTSELIGPALNWAVVLALYGEQARYVWKHNPAGCHYSTDWSQGGPIIDQEIDSISRVDAYPDYTAARMECDEWGDCSATGPTPLIAAMRCFVASKLGDEVEIPEELL